MRGGFTQSDTAVFQKVAEMVKQSSLVVTADAAKVTKESTAAGHHLGKSYLLIKQNESIDIKKKAKCDTMTDVTTNKLHCMEYCPVNKPEPITPALADFIFGIYPTEQQRCSVTHFFSKYHNKLIFFFSLTFDSPSPKTFTITSITVSCIPSALIKLGCW